MQKSYLVRPTPALLFIQLIVAALFAASIYYYLQSVRIHDAYEEKILAVQNRNSQLRETERKILAYRQYISSVPTMFQTPVQLKWEEVNLAWNNIPFSELLHRLNGVYSGDRIFVLKSFSFARKSETGPAVSAGNVGEPGQDFLSFELGGYYLCLCQ